MVDIVSDIGLECIEVACWPQEKATRRYGGVSHIDVLNLTESKASEILEYTEKKKVEISALAYYPNPLDADESKRKASIAHLLKVIEASHMLGVNLVTTFIGRNQYRTVEGNLELVKEIWKDKEGFR